MTADSRMELKVMVIGQGSRFGKMVLVMGGKTQTLT
jgi:hypothetical protein